LTTFICFAAFRLDACENGLVVCDGWIPLVWNSSIFIVLKNLISFSIVFCRSPLILNFDQYKSWSRNQANQNQIESPLFKLSSRCNWFSQDAAERSLCAMQKRRKKKEDWFQLRWNVLASILNLEPKKWS